MLSNTKEGLKTDMKNAERAVKERGREVIEEQAGDIVDMANRTGRTLRRYYDAAQDELQDDYANLSTHIRNKPVQSSLIALSIGVLLGAILRR